MLGTFCRFRALGEIDIKKAKSAKLLAVNHKSKSLFIHIYSEKLMKAFPGNISLFYLPRLVISIALPHAFAMATASFKVLTACPS